MNCKGAGAKAPLPAPAAPHELEALSGWRDEVVSAWGVTAREGTPQVQRWREVSDGGQGGGGRLSSTRSTWGSGGRRAEGEEAWGAEGGAALTWAGAAPARGSRAGPAACLHGRSRRRRLPSRSRSRGAGDREPGAQGGERAGRGGGAWPGHLTRVPACCRPETLPVRPQLRTE